MGKKDSIAAPACIQCFKAATLWSFMVDFIVMVGCIFGVYQLSTSIDINFGRYINYQLSTINYQLSTINSNYQLSTSTFLDRRLFCALHGPMIFGLKRALGPSIRPADLVIRSNHKARKRPLWMRFCALPQISAVLQKIICATVNGYNMNQYDKYIYITRIYN